jgi:hypothetical protein
VCVLSSPVRCCRANSTPPRARGPRRSTALPRVLPRRPMMTRCSLYAHPRNSPSPDPKPDLSDLAAGSSRGSAHTSNVPLETYRYSVPCVSRLPRCLFYRYRTGTVCLVCVPAPPGVFLPVGYKRNKNGAFFVLAGCPPRGAERARWAQSKHREPAERNCTQKMSFGVPSMRPIGKSS